MSKVAVQCHCGTLKTVLTLNTTLPHAAIPCHCNICRHLTGALTFSTFPISPSQSPSIESYVTSCGLTKFASSASIDRYFCPTCGSHVFLQTGINLEPGQREWSICSGLVEGVAGEDGSVNKAQLERIVGNEFVADTRDGGLARVLDQPAAKTGPPIKCYAEDPGEKEMNLREYVDENKHLVAEAEKDDTLQAYCYCKGVKFQLTRPDPPDRKYQAGLCMCRSCRLSIGQPIVPWAFTIKNSKLIQEDGTVHDGSLFGTLKRFQSSERATRDFCTRCGAGVFFYTTHQPGLVDIMSGVFNAKDGALAKSWFSWKDTRGVHYKEDAVDVELLQLVDDNFSKLEDF